MAKIQTVTNEGDYKDIPSWAKYFLTAGLNSSVVTSNNQTGFLACIVPTRSFGAAFAACGSVINNAISENSARIPNQLAINKFENLEINASLTIVYDGGRSKPGKFLGLENRKNEKSIKIQTSLGNRRTGPITTLIPISETHRIRLDNEETERTLGINEKMVVPNADHTFLSNLIGEDKVDDFLFNSSSTTVIVGRENLLREELSQRLFVSGHGNNMSRVSTLQDLIRIKRFTRNISYSFRSRFIHDNARSRKIDLDNMVNFSTNPTVIFDGARSFIRWGDSMYGSHSIVIIPRNDRHFKDAVTAVNERYSLSDKTNIAKRFNEPVPNGVETVFFEESL